MNEGESGEMVNGAKNEIDDQSPKSDENVTPTQQPWERHKSISFSIEIHWHGEEKIEKLKDWCKQNWQNRIIAYIMLMLC